MPCRERILKLEKRSNIFLAVLVALYLVLTGAYSAVTPAATPDQHNPDENAHMIYVQTLASGHLPVFTDAQHGYENHQPPLYYALCVPADLAMRGRGDVAAAKAVRWVSVLLGALLIFVTYRLALALRPGGFTLALGTAAFVALLPSNVALNASVTNDSLTTLIVAVALWLLAKLIAALEDKARFRLALWLGVTLGLGIWTKTLTLSLFPTVAVTFLLLARQEIMRGETAAKCAGLALGIGGLIGAPWLIRNTLFYGDPLAQHLLLVTLNNGTNNVPIEAMIALFGGLGGYFAKVAQWSFASFWGGFDSMRLFWGQDPQKPHPNFLHGLNVIYQLILLVSLVSFAGLLPRGKQKIAWQNPLLWAPAAQIVFTGIAFLNYNLHFFQAQGRYLYPALPPISFFFVWGWQNWLTRKLAFPLFVGLISVGLLALNAYTLFGLLLPRFAGQ